MGCPPMGGLLGLLASPGAVGRLEGQDVVKQTQALRPGGSRRQEAIKRLALHCVAWEFSLGGRLESPETPRDRFKWEKGHAWDAALPSPPA